MVAERGTGLQISREDGGEVYHLHVDQLTREDRPDRSRCEKGRVASFKGQLERHA